MINNYTAKAVSCGRTDQLTEALRSIMKASVNEQTECEAILSLTIMSNLQLNGYSFEILHKVEEGTQKGCHKVKIMW